MTTPAHREGSNARYVIRYRFTVGDAVLAYWQLFIGWPLAFGLAGLVFASVFPSHMSTGLFWFVAAAVLILVSSRLLLPSARPELTLELTDAGVKVRQRGFENAFGWDAVSSGRESRRFITLYDGRSPVLRIPRRALEANGVLAEATAFVRERLGSRWGARVEDGLARVLVFVVLVLPSLTANALG